MAGLISMNSNVGSKKFCVTRVFMIRFIFTITFIVGCSTAVYSASRGIDLRADTDKPQLASTYGDYHALIIGNMTYADKNKLWQTLKTPLSGVTALKSLLKNTYQFSSINVVENGTRRDIILALSALNKKIKTNDNVLVYYAGHGYLDENSGLGYWIPTDAVGNDHTTYIRNSTIRDELSVISRRAKHTLLISDSCFSGSLLKSDSRGTTTINADQRFFQRVAQKKSVQIITAGGNEFVDDDYKDSGQSPFTHFLINELKHNNAPQLSASELAFQVRRAVSGNVDQTPQAGVLQGAGDELGEFIFVNKKVIDSTPSADEKITDVKSIDDIKNKEQVIKREPNRRNRIPMPVI